MARVRVKIRAAVLVPIRVATQVQARTKAIRVKTKAAIPVITRVVDQRRTKASVQVRTVRAATNKAEAVQVKAKAAM